MLLEGDSTSDEAISFYINAIETSISLECKEETMPDQFKHIAVMAVVAMCNQRGNEGYNNSKEGEISIDIARDVLSPYRRYFQRFVEDKEKDSGKVVFY